MITFLLSIAVFFAAFFIISLGVIVLSFKNLPQ